MIRRLFEGQERGECVGEWDSFKFNSKKDPVTKAMCESCTVRDACLNYGLHNERFGIWGGINEDERAEMRKVLGITTPPLLGYESLFQAPAVHIRRARDAERVREWREKNPGKNTERVRHSRAKKKELA